MLIDNKKKCKICGGKYEYPEEIKFTIVNGEKALVCKDCMETDPEMLAKKKNIDMVNVLRYKDCFS